MTDIDAIRQRGDVGKCPQCGKQSRSYSRGCAQCEFGRPSVDEPTAALERALDAKYAALGEVGQLRVQLGRVEDQLTAANRRADGLANDLRSAVTANTAYANENARLRQQRDAHTDVVEAAKASVAATEVIERHRRYVALVAAVDALPKTEATR